MYYDDLIKDINEKLKNNNLDMGLSSYLIEYLLNKSEKEYYNNILINKNIIKKYNKAIERLIKQEPIQYIMGYVNFYGYHFLVSRSTLIPRFETEELVSYTISYIKKHFSNDISLVDIGTGSGAIGLTIKKELSNLDVIITDKSSRAMNIALKNAYNLDIKVNHYLGDMLEPLLDINKKYDILISNPPYIRLDERVMPIVKNNEPQMALYAGKKGLIYYRKILKYAHKILKPKSLIALEIGSSQSNDIIKLISIYLPNSKYEIKNDLQGRERMIFIFNNL